VSNKILQYVEVDCDYCSLTYGTDPCAANNTPTGIGSKLLMHMQSGGDGLRDFSPAAHGRPTVNGTTAGFGGTGAQSVFGGTSCVFPGVNQYLQFPDSPDWNQSADFTIDYWLRLVALPSVGSGMCVCSQYGGDTVNYWLTLVDGTGNTYLVNRIGGTDYYTIGPTALATGQWYHIAHVRSGGTQTTYVNGVGGTPLAVPTPADIAGPLQIGAWATSSYFLNGYVDELRISPTARWLSNFTPPAAAYSEDPRLYNKLVLHCDGPSLSTVFPDSSVAAHGNATVLGAAQMSTSIKQFGTACGFFDGSTAQLTFNSSPDFDFGSGDFTIDWWEYRSSVADTNVLMCRDATALTYQPFLVGYCSTGIMQFYSSSNTTSWDIVAGLSLGSVVANVWSHRAIVRQGDTFYGYKNGVQTGTATSALTIPANSNSLSIGRWVAGGGASWFVGYLDELRISKFARFPNGTTFTPPTTSDNAPTGTRKCFNTAVTCQDRLNFNNVPATLRFAVPTADLPASIDCIPNIKQIDFDPATISLGQDLGQRATLTVSFDDHKHSDTGPGFDKYLSTRTYDPYKQGTFWGKFRARQPFLRGNKIRWITGNTDQALSAMETRNYIIDSFTGPDNDGVFQIIAKDILKLTDGDRSVAPNLSNGFLTASITNVQTTMTVSPTGVGAQYPASGYVNIGGSEIVSFTRSGDNFTIVRAQLGTPANSHSGQDRVQLCIRYSAQSPDLIIKDLLTTYAGVPSAYIPSTAWATEIAAHLNRVYTATIANPTSVNDLISELCEQAGLSVWWDDRNQQIGLLVLRGLIYSNYLFDENSTIADTLKIEEQPDKRLSQVHTYFGQINPLTSLTDSANYRSSSFIIDAQSEADYGSPALKEIFSRWIPALGRTIADRLGAILIGRFKDPPRKISLAVMRNSTPEILLAGGYQAGGWPMQDETGARETANVQVTRLKPNADTIDIELEEVLFTAPPEDLNIRNIIVDADTTNLNIRSVHDSLFPAPDATTIVVITINSGVRVYSLSGATVPAINMGSWPTGVTLIVSVAGGVRGAGGNGGGYAGGGAQQGGTAIYTRVPIKLAVPAGATLWGGGGGSGGSLAGSTGGSGGAGISAGGAGANAGNPGYPGSEFTGGGLPVSSGNSGGKGGDPGQPGETGQTLSPTYHGWPGGAAGYAIDGVSFTTKGTWDGTTFTATGTLAGDVRGTQGN
jgi:hypothetical protein